MFLLYCLTLLALIYVAPALAVYPRLLLSSRSVVAVPFVSIAVIGVAQTLMVWSGFYTRAVVIVFSSLLAAIALVRVAALFRRRPHLDWPATHKYLLFFALLLGSYWAARLGTSGFDTHDEIYSWNMWAIQHYLGREIDYYYTSAPYPQLFAVLISYNYKLLGNVELQLPVRTLFALFPVALWGAIAVAPGRATCVNAVRSVVVMLLLAAAIGRYFGFGLADPLMAASLVVAVSLFIRYRETPKHREWLAWSVVCAAVALFAKQPALIWALFSFPLIAVMEVFRRRLPLSALFAAAATAALGLAWVLGPGMGFQDNQGVIAASQHGRGPLEQLVFATTRQFSGQPLLPLFLAAAVTAVTQTRRQRDIALFFLLPALIIWLLYGAYSLRLGIHLVALSALLLASTDYALPVQLGGGSLARMVPPIRHRLLPLTVLAVILAAGAALFRANANIHKIDGRFSPYAGGPNTIAKFFGADTEVVIRETYDRPDRLLWVPSNYIYGIFYGHTPMMRPGSLDPAEYDAKALLGEIRRMRPDYLFDSGDEVAFGPGAMRLRELARQRCPELFETRAAPRDGHGYTLYRLRKDDTLIAQCGESLNSEVHSDR